MNKPTIAQQIRDVSIGLAVLFLAVVFGYRHFYPAEVAGTSDRIDAAATAFLEVQPAALEKAAQAIDAGFLKADGIPEFIKNAHATPSADFASALKDASYSSSALRRAAAAQRKRMR